MLDLTMCKFHSSVRCDALIAGELTKLRVDGQPASTPGCSIEQVTQKYSGSFAISTAQLFLLCILLI